MKELFSIPATFDGITYRKDKGLSLRFVTQELSDEEKSAIQELYSEFGWVVFSPNEVQKKDIPTVVAPNKKLSPSQEIRLSMVAAAKRLGVNPDEYYIEQMRKYKIQQDMVG